MTADVGALHDIHPKNKKPVGRRLALAALAKVYAKPLIFSGPVFEKAAPEPNGWLRMSFRHAEGGLMDVDGGALGGFEVAGANGVFYPADASIDGETVRARSVLVPSPKSARYSWADSPSLQLFNKSLLPASPFRCQVLTGAEDWMLYR